MDGSGRMLVPLNIYPVSMGLYMQIWQEFLAKIFQSYACVTHVPWLEYLDGQCLKIGSW